MKIQHLNRGFGVLASALLMVSLGAAPAMADFLYDDIQAGDATGQPETYSYASLATGTSSFGSVIVPGTSGSSNIAEVMMSNYATASQYGAPAGSSYTVNMELSLYQVTGSGSGSTPDTVYGPTDLTLVNSTTQNFNIAYRPEANTTQTCMGNNSDAYTTGNPNNPVACGQLAELDFNFPVTLSSSNTYVWEATILGGSAATASLNWELNPGVNNLTVASNPEYDTNYLNGVGSTGWAYIGQGEVAFVAGTPEPATFGLIGLGLLGIGMSVRKKSRKS